jgi:hypothetical protein
MGARRRILITGGGSLLPIHVNDELYSRPQSTQATRRRSVASRYVSLIITPIEEDLRAEIEDFVPRGFRAPSASGSRFRCRAMSCCFWK